MVEKQESPDAEPEMSAQQQQQQQQPTVLLVTGGYDHTIRFWEALSGICVRTIQHQDSQVNRLSISPDKKILAAAAYGNVKFYDIENEKGAPFLNLEGHIGNVTAVQFHCDGRWVATSSEDGKCKIWDTRSAGVQRTYDHKSPVNDVVIHPNQGELIACDQKGSIKVWDLAENKCTVDLLPQEDISMRSVSVASDASMLIAGNNKGTCYAWKIQSHHDTTQLLPVKAFQAHNTYLTRCVLAPDARTLATCSADTTVRCWSATNFEFKQEKELIGHQRWVWDCAFSADSAYLMTASSDHTARLWDLSSSETIRTYSGHHKAACCVALHDGAA